VKDTFLPRGQQEAEVMSKIKKITLSGSRLGVAIVAAATTAVIVGGVGWASIPDGSGVVHGCYKTAGTNHKLSVINSAVTTSCPHGYTSLNWNQNPVARMDDFDASNYAVNLTSSWVFVSATVPESFTDANTGATVTGTIDFASDNGEGIDAYFGVCYEEASTSTIENVGYVGPEFTSPAYSYFAQTVSATVGDLSPGTYDLGLCTMEETSNVVHGSGHGTIVLAETASGVTSSSVKKAGRAAANR
jgi:hypothetical protein